MRAIHQIWIGPHAPPLEWTETWRVKNPDWEYKLWRETDIRSLPLHNSKLFEYCLESGMYDAASDVARVEILYRFGGVYIDADSVCLRPLEERFSSTPFWAVEEPGTEHTFLVANGFIGAAKPEHDFLRRYVSALSRIDYSTLHPLNCYIQTGPGLITRLLWQRTDEKIFPPWDFFACSLIGEPIFGAPLNYQPFCEHYYSSTHEKNKNLFTKPYPR